jgi:hypothetical protein
MAHRALKIPLEFTPMFVISLTIMIMYVCGYIGQLNYNDYGIPVGFNKNSKPQIHLLQISIWLLFSGGLISIIYWLWLLRNNRKEIFKTISSPVIVISILGTLVLYQISRYCWFNAHDDITHWGITIRELYFNGGFQGIDSNTAHYHYPIACGLWGDYVANILSISVPNMIFAQLLFQCSAIIVMLRQISYKRPMIIVAILVFPYLFTNLIFIHGFFTILADILLGLWFSGIVLSYVFRSMEGVSLPEKILFLIPSLSILLMIKETGIIFFVIVIAIILTDIVLIKMSKIWSVLSGKKEHVTNKISICLFAKLLPFIYVLLLVLIPVSLKYTWKIRMDSIGRNERLAAFSENSIKNRLLEIKSHIEHKVSIYQPVSVLFSRQQITQIKSIVKDSLTPDELTVVNLFKTFMNEQQQYIHCSYCGMTMILVAISLTIPIVMCVSNFTMSRKILWICSIWMIIGCFIYLTALLLAWMFAMLPYSNRPTLGGSERYPQTYYLGWTVVLFGLLCYCLQYRNSSNVELSLNNRNCLGLIIFCLFLTALARPSSLLIYTQIPIQTSITKAAIKRTESEFPHFLYDTKYALYCRPIPVMPRSKLHWFVTYLGTPGKIKPPLFTGRRYTIPEPHEESFANLDIEYLFFQCSPPEDYWTRNYVFFTDGDKAKNYTTFRITFDENRKPSLKAVEGTEVKK